MKWDNSSTKESHPGKPLTCHISEVKNIFKVLADFYAIPDDVRVLLEPIIEHHDDGKLNSEWNVRNDRNPPHAEFSIRYMNETRAFGKIKKDTGSLYPLVPYLILKHHSPLTDVTSANYDGLKKLCSEIVRTEIKKITIKQRVEIADAFGLFKLADSLSAADRPDFRPKRPSIKKERIWRMLQPQDGPFDEDRWKQQLRLSTLPRNSLLTAPTGWGKTDASPLFFISKPVRRIFYLFPTITAINKFYSKLLIHPPDAVDKYFYLYDYELANRYGETDLEAREFQFSDFTASHFLNPIVLTTVDQFLLSFLQLGRYYTKRVMFKNAGIVLDEIHLVNPKMLVLLLHFLKAFSRDYQLSVIFMSATLSKALARIIVSSISGVGQLDLSSRYKELRRTDFQFDDRKTVLDSVEKIKSQFKSGKKVLVVVNTVSCAVELAQKLQEPQMGIPDKLRVLLHARFTYRDRVKKENDIEELQKKPHVLVATQVCEVSLDVSYDVLFTELAPIPSLVQRFGRVNRAGKFTRGTNVWIYRESRRRDSSKYPYEQTDLGEARKVLDALRPLENEYQLIKQYNEVEDYNTLSRRISEAESDLDFEALWESDERTAYFFSFKLDDDETRRRLLKFREELTTGIIPHPECFSTETKNDLEEKQELSRLLERYEVRRKLSRGQRAQLFAKLKGYLVPVPIWWVLGKEKPRRGGVPLFLSSERRYTSKYGFLEQELPNVL